MYITTVKLNSNRKKPLTHLMYRFSLADMLIGQCCSRKTFGPNRIIPSIKRKLQMSKRAVLYYQEIIADYKMWVITCPLLENIIAVGFAALKKMLKDQKSTAMNVRSLFA